jgi:hypothetical protein
MEDYAVLYQELNEGAFLFYPLSLTLMIHVLHMQVGNLKEKALIVKQNNEYSPWKT